MLRRLAFAFLVLTFSTAAQSYSGYSRPDGQTLTPLVSYKANAVLTCPAAFSSDPINYPGGCYINGWMLRLGKMVTAPSAGTAYLYCQGQAYLTCTLTVRNPGSPPAPGPITPVPSNDPYQGSGWIGLGGGNEHRDGCNRQGMKIGVPATVTAAQPVDATFSIDNFGGGFCSTTSGGYVVWGDGSKPDRFPTVSAPKNDSCAAEGTQRLGSTTFKLTHTYLSVEDTKIFATARGDFKDNGDPGGATKGDRGNSGSWRCTEQKFQGVKVVAPVATEAKAVPICRIKRRQGPCAKLKAPISPKS
jgi:hypothetical protein